MELEAAEAEVVGLEASAFARALPEPSARARYAQLAAAAQSGAIPDELIGPLETMLELVFDTGRPTNRAVLQGVFAKTPRGRLRAAAAREVNRALETLRHELERERQGCQELDAARVRALQGLEGARKSVAPAAGDVGVAGSQPPAR